MADYSDIHVPPDISLPDLLHLIVILNSSVLVRHILSFLIQLNGYSQTESILYGTQPFLTPFRPR